MYLGGPLALVFFVFVTDIDGVDADLNHSEDGFRIRAVPDATN